MAREDTAATKGVSTAPSQAETGGLERLMQSLGPNQRALPPVERWNPPFCGHIDMRIARDGQWFYLGTPIGRPALVKLFASVLIREDEQYFLVTPAEKVGITVDDAPFQAVELGIDGEGDARRLSFRTNVDDLVTLEGSAFLRFEIGEADGVRPYVHVRRNLWARLTRALTLDLLALGDVRQHDGQQMFGIAAGGIFHPVMAADLIGDLR